MFGGAPQRTIENKIPPITIVVPETSIYDVITLTFVKLT